MAGTIQTLILTPHFTKTPSFRLHSPLSTRSVSFSSARFLPLRITAKASAHQGNGGHSQPPMRSGLALSLQSFGSNNFLPLALIGGVIMGLVNPSLGCVADRFYLSKFSTFAIFIISGLTLQNGEIGAAVEAWPVGFFGLCSILFLTPCFSKLLLQIKLQPQEFVTGLALFCCMPTTLSSGVALTQLAGGNSALALAMTVISNLLGILMIPLLISTFIATGVGVSVPTKQLFRSLVLMLLVPLILGKVFRESSNSLADFVDGNRKVFSKISALFLALVPWIQVSRSSSLLLMVKPEVFLVAIGMGVVLHLILLAFNIIGIQGLAAVSGGNESVFSKKENANAFLLVASQCLSYSLTGVTSPLSFWSLEKTLPVLAAVVEQLGGAFGESGLLVLPCVAAHLLQIIMDSFLVNIWMRNDLSSKNAKVA